MLNRVFYVFVALCAVKAQEAPVIESEINLGALLDLVRQIIQELRESDNILPGLLDNLDDFDGFGSYIDNLLEKHEESLREETVCLLNIYRNSNTETQETIIELISELIHLYELIQLRDEQLAHCESLADENSGVLQQAHAQACRLQVTATTSAQITISTYKIQALASSLEPVLSDARTCISRSSYIK